MSYPYYIENSSAPIKILRDRQSL